MIKNNPRKLATSLVGWLIITLSAALLAACGSSDGSSSLATTAKSSTEKEPASTETALRVPKFSEVKFSPSGANKSNSPSQVSKSSIQAMASERGYVTQTQWIWNSHRINVCWENPSTWNDQQREWVKQAVTSTWDANSDVTFVDWTTCPAYDFDNPYLGIRLAIVSGQPITRQAGEAGIRWRSNVQLNLDFQSWSPNCYLSRPLETCVKTVAVHEFGHLLAFAHEQDRPDLPQECKDQGLSTGWTDGVVFGPWDANSVMNYCNPVWMGLGELSSIDISMVQKYYGKPGSKIYSVFTANDPPIVVIQDSKNFNYAAPYLTIPNADGFVLRHFAAAPNGYRVAYALVNGQKGNSILGNIDTLTDTLKGRKEIAERVLDMKLSGDSKYAYVVWQQGAAGGLRAYDLDTLAVVWDLPLAGARQIAAQRTATSQRLYVVKNDGQGSAQSIVVVDVNSHTQTAMYSVGTAHSQPLVVGLTPDEKILYLVDPGTDSQGAPFIAKLDAESGQYNVLQTISPADAGVHDLHVLDSNQILLATNKQGIAPLIYTVDKRSFSAITDGIPSNWSLPFVYSPDGKVVFTMGQYWDGGIPYYSLIRLDSYRLNSATEPVVWDGSNHPVWSAGFGQDVVSRPFAVVYR